MPESGHDTASKSMAPQYGELVRFLVQPFLELPESLKVDCEVSHSKSKVWVRLAFEGSDKGRVFGRGGRNIQAIRSVLEAAAKAVGYSAYLDVYGGVPQGRTDDFVPELAEKSSPRRSPSKGAPKPRPH